MNKIIKLELEKVVNNLFDELNNGENGTLDIVDAIKKELSVLTENLTL